jgi:hypothetical protein
MIEAMSTIPTQVLPMPVFSAITSPYLERFDRQDDDTVIRFVARGISIIINALNERSRDLLIRRPDDRLPDFAGNRRDTCRDGELQP